MSIALVAAQPQVRYGADIFLGGKMTTKKVVLKVGDDVSTDIIYPGRFMATVLP